MGEKAKFEKMKMLKEYGKPAPKYDKKIIMQEMLDWVKKETSLSFCDFCYSHGYLPRLIWTYEKQDPDFEEVYTMVKMKLAERRERYVNSDQLNYGVWARYAKGLDPFLSKEEDLEKDKDAARQKGIANEQQDNLLMIAKLAAEGKIRQKD